MLHLGSRAFETIGGEVVQTTTFVFRKSISSNYKSSVYRLLKYDANQKRDAFLENKEKKYEFSFKNVLLMPNTPFAYWINQNTINAFLSSKLSQIGDCKTGMTTGDNDRFLRRWYEIDSSQIHKKYRFYNKGGGFRKWYGNIDFVINWQGNGHKVKSYAGSTIRNENYYFRPCVSWNLITTDVISTRYLNDYFVMGDAGPAFYDKNNDLNNLYYVLALLNSNVADYLLKIINPTINYSCGVMDSFPYVFGQFNETVKLSKECTELLKSEWDSHEISFEFSKHPLIKKNSLISDVFESLVEERKNNVNRLIENEKRINELFVNLYNLQDDVSIEVNENFISLPQINKTELIKEFISYLIGVKMGRYSLDMDGIYFGGTFENKDGFKEYMDDDGYCLFINS